MDKFKVGDNVWLKGEVVNDTGNFDGTPYKVKIEGLSVSQWFEEENLFLDIRFKAETPKVVQAFRSDDVLHVLYDNGELWNLGEHWVKITLPREEKEKE